MSLQKTVQAPYQTIEPFQAMVKLSLRRNKQQSWPQIWVLEINSSYHNPETVLLTVDPNYSNLNLT